MYDLGFGNSVCVRQAFLDTYHGNMVVFTQAGLEKFDYPDRFGDPEIIKITRDIIERQMGENYRHVFLTNGATGAVTIALRAYKQRGKNICYTRKAPWYLRYPTMIEASGLIHLDETKGIDPEEGVILLDIPSNPEGYVHPFAKSIIAPTVLDAVYFNRVYSSGYHITVPKHDVMCGSYSKLLGLNGLRVGWIATNDDLLAERIKLLIMGEYCGLCVASGEIIKNVLYDFDWLTFELIAKENLNRNREEFRKLESYLGRPVPGDGMFYYGFTGKKIRDVLQKAGITYTSGWQLGTDDNWGRFNLGQDVELVRKAVRAFQKADRIR